MQSNWCNMMWWTARNCSCFGRLVVRNWVTSHSHVLFGKYEPKSISSKYCTRCLSISLCSSVSSTLIRSRPRRAGNCMRLFSTVCLGTTSKTTRSASHENRPHLFSRTSFCNDFVKICIIRPLHFASSPSSCRQNSFSSPPSESHSSSSPSADGKAAVTHNFDDNRSIRKSLQKLENSLRFHGYSTLRIGLAICVALGFVVYLLREPIRDNVAVEVSQVATRSLEHEDVVGKAEEFAKSLLHTILHDDHMHKVAAQFITQVLNSPETRKASIEYIASVLEDPQTRQLLAATIKQVLLLAINDPETTAALKGVVAFILSDPESQQAARQLISAVFKHEELKELASEFFRDIIQSQVVVDQATQLGKDVTYNVITDPALKEETGKSLWHAVKYTVTPRWFADSSPTSPSPPPPSEVPSSSTTSQPPLSVSDQSPPDPSLLTSSCHESPATEDEAKLPEEVDTIDTEDPVVEDTNILT